MKDKSWMSVADMMAGLMIIFLFIAIAYIREIGKKTGELEDLVEKYENIDREIYEALRDEFAGDQGGWEAIVDKENAITIRRFKKPDVFFNQGSDQILPEYEEVLKDFFPRYISTLAGHRFRDAIEEIRIEGHTSSEWKKGMSEKEIYLKNLELSQNRARSVLRHCFLLQDEDLTSNSSWLKAALRANGVSFARRVFSTEDSPELERPILREDRIRSRRVDFRVMTRTKERFDEIKDRVKG